MGSSTYHPNPQVRRSREAMRQAESSDHSGESLGDSVHRHMQQLSEKLFNWTDEDHRQAAEHAEQRAKELRDSESGPRAFKFDQSGRIKDFEDAAKYHRSKITGSDSSQNGDNDE